MITGLIIFAFFKKVNKLPHLLLILAAIDIGSNAIRMQINNVDLYAGKPQFKKREYIRFPLRLGHDVFNYHEISDLKALKLVKLMQSFKLLIELYETTDHRACATSAMREANNGQEMIQRIYEETGLKIEIIDGDMEAELIDAAIQTHLPGNTCLHIDVGGGSTELNIYHNAEKVASRSFQMGSVRSLEQHALPEVEAEMQEWVKAHLAAQPNEVLAIGTGGNINKLYELSGKKEGKALSYHRLTQMRAELGEMSTEQRRYDLKLNPDRADVIVPAAGIYLSAMAAADAKSILVPDVGLKDGIMQYLYKRNKHLL